MHNAKMRLSPQKKDGWCGPAALSYALKEQGVLVSQDKLAKVTGTTVDYGVDPKPLKQAAERYGMDVSIKQFEDAEKGLQELKTHKKNGYSIIVDYIAGDNVEMDGHYVLFLDRIGDYIYLSDPSYGKPRAITVDYFTSHWKDTTRSGKLFKRLALVMKRAS